MATNPIRRIRVETMESGFITNIGAELLDLAHLSPSLDSPYLSVYLDWRPDGRDPSRRVAETVFKNQVADLTGQFPYRSTGRESFDADVAAIEALMEDGIDPASQGVFIVANHDLGVFETMSFALPVKTRIDAGPTPKILPLAALAEDNPRYAVLVADQLDATVTLISKASFTQSTSVESNSYPRTRKKGGFSQLRFANRRRERISHFARVVANETSRTLWTEDIHYLIIAGDEVITSALAPELDFRTREALVDTIRLDVRASEREIIAATVPIISEAEQTAEAEAVAHLRDAIGGSKFGVNGPEAVLRALQRGKVASLIMAEDYHEAGWVDYQLHVFGAGDVPEEHPYSGDIANLHRTDLAEDMVWQAIMTGAEIEIVHGEQAAAMSTLGGVGALLRWRSWG